MLYFQNLNPAEMNYGVTEKECLAIVWALQRLRHYLFGRVFTVVTDHCGLCWFTSSKRLTPRLTRWAIKLQEFNFIVKYRSGRLHGDADCVSRYPLKDTGVEDEEEINLPGRLNQNEITICYIEPVETFRDVQKRDAYCLKIRALSSHRYIVDIVVVIWWC